MAEEISTAPGPRARARGGPLGGTTALSFALLGLALVLLLVLPILIRQRSDDIRRTATEISEPARDQAQAIERDLATQVAAVLFNELTGEPALVQRFDSAGRDAAGALARLQPLAARLGPDAAAAVTVVKVRHAAWQDVAETRLRGAPGNARREGPLALQESLFQATIAATRQLDAAIGAAIEQRRREATRIDAAATIITVILGLLVLGSGALLVRLAQQLRRLAEESRRRAQHEQALRVQLESTMESRARLIRGFSHDVRNPLGAADGYAQLLEAGVFGALEPRQQESVTRIRRAISSASLLISDLLDLARLEAGQLQITEEPVNLPAVVGETAEEYRAQAETAGLRLSVQQLDGPLALRSDPRRIHQVLGNLLSNAIKYTPQEGRITVGLTRAASGSRRPGEWVGIQVADTGIGIDPEQRAHIFDEFARLQPDAAHGLGLGLAISLRLARALGGDITLESEPGMGSTFTLWLPLQR